ncbi:hypothetical protein PDQ36_27865 [Bacillus cereus]|nr:hypothetical protein [Bacillus cereus]
MTVSYNEKGNPIRHSKMVTVKNKLEVEKKLALFIAEIEAGEYRKPQKMLFKDFIKEWKKKYTIDNLSPQIYETYCSHLKLRILPSLGNMELEDIKPMHLMTLAHQLKSVNCKD